MLFNLFVEGSLVFWIVFVLVPICLVLYLVEIESGAGAFFVLLAAVILVHLLSDVNLVPWIIGHAPLLLLLFFGYFVGGVIYGWIKWYFFCLDQADTYANSASEYKQQYESNKSISARADYKTWLRRVHSFPPSPSDYGNKSRIMLWMTYWPFSALVTLIRDPFKYIWRALYEWVAHTYTQISYRVFSRFTDLA